MPEWLPAPGAQALELVHERTGRVIASRIELAVTRQTRRVGLLGRSSLEPAAALVLAPCCMIHTAFMRFSIDVLFIDRQGLALRVVHGLTPWRAAGSLRAYAAIEMAAGVLRRHTINTGDRIHLQPVALSVNAPAC